MQDLVQMRQHRARKIAWFLQVVPFVRFIGLTGSLAYDIAKKESDIDIFIVSKKDRIYTCRFLVIGLLKALQIYHSDNTYAKRAGKICPNRFVTDNYLLINPQNRYHAQEYTQMVPLFNYDDIYRKFLNTNKWMEKYGYFPPKKAMSLTQSGNILTNIRKICEWVLNGYFGNRLERNLKNRQTNELKKNKKFNVPGSGIYADDNEIRIHPHPR
jgi:predicted nucleotidyltransferase